MAADNYDVTKDRYASVVVPQASMPARFLIAVTPSDTKDVTDATGDAAPCYAKALYVGTAGNLAVVPAASTGAGTAVTLTGVTQGWIPIQVRRVMATNTTATNIVGLYDQ